MPGFGAVGQMMTGGQPKSGPQTQPGDPDVNYRPSPARTVRVLPGTRAFEALGDFFNMDDPKRPRGVKDPNSTIDVSIDWTPWLDDAGDTVAAFSWTVNGGAQQVAAGALDGIATLFVTLGTPGLLAELTCRITTNSTPPRTEDRTITLTIEDR